MSVRSPSRPPLSQQLARWGGGAAMAFAGTSHLTFARKGFRAQVPPWVPIDTDDVVLLSGAVEIALGLGLDTDRKRLVRLFLEPLMWAAALHAGGLLPRRSSRR